MRGVAIPKMLPYTDLCSFWAHAGSRKNVCWMYYLYGARIQAIVNKNAVQYMHSHGPVLNSIFCGFDEALIVAVKGFHTPIVFDGIMVHVDESSNKQLLRFSALPGMRATGFRFRVFDLVDCADFRERHQKMHKILPAWSHGDLTTSVAAIRHYPIFRAPKEMAVLGHNTYASHGILLKTWDHLYQDGRSIDWCHISPV